MRANTSIQPSKTRNIPVPAAPEQRVRLEFRNPTANSVFVAGSFNDWHPAASEMIDLGNGHWIKELTLKPGVYEYRFVADGVWITDPACPETSLNPFGTNNSVLRVAEPVEIAGTAPPAPRLHSPKPDRQKAKLVQRSAA